MNPGIYKITNIITKDFYVGSSCQLKTRKNNHFKQLENNKHNNKYLQFSYNKYKKESFNFEILLLCPKEYLLKMEQHYIDTLKPTFNLLKKAGNSLGYKHTKISLLKLKTHNKQYCSKYVYQYDLNNDFIKKWNSCSEYAKYYKISRIAVIKAIKKHHKCRGFIVSYNPPTL